MGPIQNPSGRHAHKTMAPCTFQVGHRANTQTVWGSIKSSCPSGVEHIPPIGSYSVSYCQAFV